MMSLLGGFAQTAGLLETDDNVSDAGSESDIATISILSSISAVVPDVQKGFSSLSILSGRENQTETQNGDGSVTKIYADGEIYEGPLVKGLRHGDGAFSIRKDGSKFSGSYDSDRPSEGTLITSEYTYIGPLQKERFHGTGTLMSNDGAVYRGQFDDGLRHGSGKETSEADEEEIELILRKKLMQEMFFSSNAGKIFVSYSGDFYLGKRHGLGTLEDMDGHCLYNGLFINGKRAMYREEEIVENKSVDAVEEKKE